MNSTDDEWISADEAVKMLGLSINTLYGRIRSGDILAEGHGRSGSGAVKSRTTSSDRGSRALLRSRP